ncbi:hypothetical protein ACLOJK_020786 [Asimina triloba]
MQEPALRAKTAGADKAKPTILNFLFIVFARVETNYRVVEEQTSGPLKQWAARGKISSTVDFTFDEANGQESSTDGQTNTTKCTSDSHRRPTCHVALHAARDRLKTVQTLLNAHRQKSRFSVNGVRKSTNRDTLPLQRPSELPSPPPDTQRLEEAIERARDAGGESGPQAAKEASARVGVGRGCGGGLEVGPSSLLDEAIAYGDFGVVRGDGRRRLGSVRRGRGEEVFEAGVGDVVEREELEIVAVDGDGRADDGWTVEIEG